MTAATRYIVRREFVGGLLQGSGYTEFTGVSLPVGFASKAPHFGSPFVITDSIELPEGFDCAECREELKSTGLFDHAEVDGWNDCQVASAFVDCMVPVRS